MLNVLMSWQPVARQPWVFDRWTSPEGAPLLFGTDDTVRLSLGFTHQKVMCCWWCGYLLHCRRRIGRADAYCATVSECLRTLLLKKRLLGHSKGLQRGKSGEMKKGVLLWSLRLFVGCLFTEIRPWEKKTSQWGKISWWTLTLTTFNTVYTIHTFLIRFFF